MHKLIVISAPSGAGKTSIIQYLLKKNTSLSFSVSACSREKRKHEVDGKDYYFLGINEFKKNIKENKFLEWEEVYENQFYGTLRSEIQRVWSEKKHIILDLDVIGALNIKKEFTDNCLAIFVMPPSINVLKQRLIKRGTESLEKINVRIRKAEQEIANKTGFDIIILNDDFKKASKEAEQSVKLFLK